MESICLQINDIAMGTKMAPSYANIFMGKLDKLIIQSAPYKPISWFRFMDDVDMKWTESEENLNRFFDHANNVHPTIKFMVFNNELYIMELFIIFFSKGKNIGSLYGF